MVGNMARTCQLQNLKVKFQNKVVFFLWVLYCVKVDVDKDFRESSHLRSYFVQKVITKSLLDPNVGEKLLALISIQDGRK